MNLDHVLGQVQKAQTGTCDSCGMIEGQACRPSMRRLDAGEEWVLLVH